MNDVSRIPRTPGTFDPFAKTLDALLADIAIRVQLPPGLHFEACKRYTAVREHLARPASPLAGLIVQLYPQGSMAIDATTSTRGTDDEYDLDAVVELDVGLEVPPDKVLTLLHTALIDYPVKRVTRQTRCVTLTYADGMHIDVTPARRRQGTPDFESVIFHANPGQPSYQHCDVPMNAYGFASWYRERTPPEQTFAAAYNQRLLDSWPGTAVKADPVFHDVPDQTPLPLKSVATVALQLIKRYRTILYSTRPGRYPPSVMLSCHAGWAVSPYLTLSQMVIRQARWTVREIESAARMGRLLDVRNPVMNADQFTDRWPTSQQEQGFFGSALKGLADCLEHIASRGEQLEDVQDWMREQFGRRVVSDAVRVFDERNGRALTGGTHGYVRGGGLYVPAAPALVGISTATPSIVTPRPHTNMGERR